MKEILELLESSKFVADYKIEEYREFKEGFYIKIIVRFSDDSVLFIREYSDTAERNYSYHWQDSKSNLLLRWDNSPFHKEINTFPHHKHEKGQVFPSFEITIKDVMTHIGKNISGK